MKAITVLPILLHKETAHNLATPVKYGYVRVI